jgi:hypothetical protein
MTNNQRLAAIIATTCSVLLVVLTPVTLHSDQEHKTAAATDKPSPKKPYTHAEVSFLAGTYMVANVTDSRSVPKPERVSVGYQACTSFKRGLTQDDVIDSLHYRYDFADLLVTAAYEDLCPEILTS